MTSPEQMPETLNAALIAENLNPTLATDPTTAMSGQPAMIVSPRGINIGIIELTDNEIRTQRVITYSLNGEIIYITRFGITEQGWQDTPVDEIVLADDALLYLDWN